tara:strand:+ start:292 stop:585 length:294 start_codon:yes stop_codon:yes gene_type:complete
MTTNKFKGDNLNYTAEMNYYWIETNRDDGKGWVPSDTFVTDSEDIIETHIRVISSSDRNKVFSYRFMKQKCQVTVTNKGPLEVIDEIRPTAENDRDK